MSRLLGNDRAIIGEFALGEPHRDFGFLALQIRELAVDRQADFRIAALVEQLAKLGETLSRYDRSAFHAEPRRLTVDHRESMAVGCDHSDAARLRRLEV